MQKLKYGENPQQKAWVKLVPSSDPFAMGNFHRLDGSPFVDGTVSYTSAKDLIRATRLLRLAHAAVCHETWPHAAVLVKHGNACGAAIGSSETDVLRDTCRGDLLAAFGGFLVTTFPLTAEHAEAIVGVFKEKGPPLLAGVAGPMVDRKIEAVTVRKTNRCHVIENFALLPGVRDSLMGALETCSVPGAEFTQEINHFVPGTLRCVSEPPRTVSATELDRDLRFAWAVGSVSTSNTVTLVKDGVLIANAVGQQDRVGACELALWRARRAGHLIPGAVAYSDSFFPFPDGVEVLAGAGIVAIFATSGSVRDDAIFTRARERGIGLFVVPDSEGRGFYGH